MAGLLLSCTALLVFPSSLLVSSLHPVLLSALSALCLACLCCRGLILACFCYLPCVRVQVETEPCVAFPPAMPGPFTPLCTRRCAVAGHTAPSHPTSASVLWRVYDVYLPRAASRSFLFYYHGGEAPALVYSFGLLLLALPFRAPPPVPPRAIVPSSSSLESVCLHLAPSPLRCSSRSALGRCRPSHARGPAAPSLPSPLLGHRVRACEPCRARPTASPCSPF